VVRVVGLRGGLDQHLFVCFAGPHPRQPPALASLAPVISNILPFGLAVCPVVSAERVQIPVLPSQVLSKEC
jgi:hypothetical protein